MELATSAGVNVCARGVKLRWHRHSATTDRTGGMMFMLVNQLFTPS